MFQRDARLRVALCWSSNYPEQTLVGFCEAYETMLVESCRTCLISDTGGQLSRNVIGENNFWFYLRWGFVFQKHRALNIFETGLKVSRTIRLVRGNTVKKDPWWPMSRPAFATRTTGKRTPWQDILWRNTNEGDRTIIGENIFHLKACFHLQFGSHVLYPFLICRLGLSCSIVLL